ncbi:hypothetical protein [Candidatus Phytoplasma pyri]|uniref:hypothetical protein n=1 Tax=Candidatus Phytoplasma pyri TaxID=47566 RepID=UPI00398377BC
MNSINSKKKLLKFLLIFPLIIAFIFAIYCYALTNHENKIVRNFKIMLPKLSQNSNNKNILQQYLQVNETDNVCNKKVIFSPMNDATETEQQQIPITNKTYILETTPKLLKEVKLEREYEVFLDDKVCSKEDIKVKINQPTQIQEIKYPEIITQEMKKIENIQNEIGNLNFIQIQIKDFVNKEDNKPDDIILKASRKKETENNPRLILRIVYFFDYQQFKEIAKIKELIEQNVESMDFKLAFTVYTEETTEKK